MLSHCLTGSSHISHSPSLTTHSPKVRSNIGTTPPERKHLSTTPSTSSTSSSSSPSITTSTNSILTSSFDDVFDFSKVMNN